MCLFQNSIIEFRFVVVRSFDRSSRFLSREFARFAFSLFVTRDPKIHSTIIRRVQKEEIRNIFRSIFVPIHRNNTFDKLQITQSPRSLSAPSRIEFAKQLPRPRDLSRFFRMVNEIQATLKGLLITFFAGTSNLLLTFLLSNYNSYNSRDFDREKKKESERGKGTRDERKGNKNQKGNSIKKKRTNERTNVISPNSGLEAGNFIIERCCFKKPFFVMPCLHFKLSLRDRK